MSRSVVLRDNANTPGVLPSSTSMRMKLKRSHLPLKDCHKASYIDQVVILSEVFTPPYPRLQVDGAPSLPELLSAMGFYFCEMPVSLLFGPVFLACKLVYRTRASQARTSK